MSGLYEINHKLRWSIRSFIDFFLKQFNVLWWRFTAVSLFLNRYPLFKKSFFLFGYFSTTPAKHVNIVNFEPGGVIPFEETHVMEHGLYVLEGKAVYRLNEDWIEVEAGDFMWLRSFCPQACYAGGPGRFRYLLYKDVNRHPQLKLWSWLEK